MSTVVAFGGASITAADPVPGDLRQALQAINCTAGLRTSVAEVRTRSAPDDLLAELNGQARYDKITELLKHYGAQKR